jgi:hypothetical protein
MQREKFWNTVERLFRAEQRLTAIEQKRRRLRLKLKLMKIVVCCAFGLAVLAGSYAYFVGLFSLMPG